ncbi:MAG: hypothetical protein R2688_07315 [Fimbriimonadaceae bacterium]
MGELKEGQWADYQVYDSEPKPGSSPTQVYRAGELVYDSSAAP